MQGAPVLAAVAWCDGMLFSRTAGFYATHTPTLEELRSGLEELLHGMLSPAPAGG